jgi:hypothetical protein
MKKIAYLIICILLISIFVGSIQADEISKNVNNQPKPGMTYTHTVFAGVVTGQFCEPCDAWSETMYNTYESGNYDFEYVEMITHDKSGQKLNKEADDWRKNYSIYGYPTTVFDGDYVRFQGDQPDQLPIALGTCGNRAVADISADLILTWYGDATFKIDVVIQNGEHSTYNGYIRVFISEIVSRYKTYYGNPYHHGFLDFAITGPITIGSGGTYLDSVTWNGNEHCDLKGNCFGDIDPDNIQVVLVVYDINTMYADETVMSEISYENNPPNPPSNPNPPDGEQNVEISEVLSWDCSDPDGGQLKYDVYFGATSPPPIVSSKQTQKTYDPVLMDYNTTFYWKIVAFDNHDASTEGSIWSFKTVKKKNKAPIVLINKPKQALYINDQEICPYYFRLTEIFGSITIVADASDEDENIDKVDFFINGELKGTDHDDPYTYYWTWDRLRLFHFFLITVKVTDTEGEKSYDHSLVRRFF